MYNRIIWHVVMGVIEFMFVMTCSCVTQEEDDIFSFSLAQEEEEIHKVPLADPFILIDHGRYYAYGTSSASNGFNVYISSDLKCWYKSPKYALYKDLTFGSMHFWAPEVYVFGNRFYMYYAAEERIAVATSDSPLGPFSQTQETWGCISTGHSSLDGTIYQNENNTYLFYVNKIENKYSIYVGIMNPDKRSMNFLSLKECLKVSQRWEEDNVNEGPTVVKVGEKYIMTYSAGGCTSPDYGVGVAVADDPLGPWEKYEGNPILQYPAYKGTVLEGTGHNSLFKDLDGSWRMVFHAHSAKGYEGGRYMYIVSVDLLDRPPYIVFHDDLFAPVLAEETTEDDNNTKIN